MQESLVPQDGWRKTAKTQPFPGVEPFAHPYPSHGDAARPVPFSGIVLPGQSFAHSFNTKGEFFYNDASSPQNTGRIAV